MSEPIKVLVVDDSATVRRLLTELINRDPRMTVVGVAPDAYVAREKIKQLSPHVLTLDVEMPGMDGLTFLKNLMRLRPMPVVMVSSLTQAGADTTLAALEIGAVDFATKPRYDVANTFGHYGAELLDKIEAASRARVKPYVPVREVKPVKHLQPSVDSSLAGSSVKHVIAIGASTGGTEAIKDVLIEMPANVPPIVITQHIPASFSGAFARRMNRLSPLTVFEAEDGMEVKNGHVYIAPGDRHMVLQRLGGVLEIALDDRGPVNRHKPSVDVMFDSVLELIGKNATVAILTGMGDDGARGMKRLRDAGASTIAQDEKSSVVWGMPGSAVQLGAASEVLPLSQIATRICELSGSAASSSVTSPAVRSLFGA